MYRSSSSSHVSEELMIPSTVGNEEEEQLPTYDPLSPVAQKERSRLRSAENAVHFIPLLLIFCAVVLWFFSHPDAGEQPHDH